MAIAHWGPRRSIPLNGYSAGPSGVTLSQLPKGFGTEQIPAVEHLPLVDLGQELDEGAFMDAAASAADSA